MEVIAVEYFPSSFDTGHNEENSEFHSYISGGNEQDARDSYAHMFHLLIFFSINNISVWYVNSLGRHRWLCQAIYVCSGYILNDCVIILIWYYNVYRY